jgi:hypothetical protein
MPKGTLIALQNIESNEEIVFHYCTTEYKMSSPFQCHCRSKDCIGEIKGYKYLSKEVKEKLGFQIAPHLKAIEASNK